MGQLPLMGAGPGGSGFTPLDLAGLQVWLESDFGLYRDTALTNPATLDSHALAGWQDRSGNGNHATQGTANRQPRLVNGVLNGRPVARSQGSTNHGWLLATNLLSTVSTVFIVCSKSVVTAGALRGLMRGGKYLVCSAFTASGNNWGLFAAVDIPTAQVIGPNHVVLSAVIRNFNDIDARKDGVLVNLTAGSGYTNFGSTSLMHDSATGSGHPGDMAAFLQWNRALTVAEELQVRSYLAAKYTSVAPRYYAFHNGDISVGSDYKIGRLITKAGSDTALTYPDDRFVMSAGAGGTWDDDHVKDPWVLYDAGVWKMWYAGHNGSTGYQIGYATSSDGITWVKDAANPVIPFGAASSFDETGCIFPIVYKDLAAAADRRYRMLYGGVNSSSPQQVTVGYAYSADGIAWTKGASNPVVALGGGGTFDAQSVIPGGLAKSGATYYLYYGGRTTGTFPTDEQIGLVTFSDFEGSYTKAAGNPLLARRTGNQTLTANLTAGSTTVTVASTAGFVVGEVCMLFDTAANTQQVKVASITDATHLEINNPALVAYTTANTARIQTTLRALCPRTVVLEGGLWRMWLTAYQAGKTVPEVETTYYATSVAPDSGWALDHGNSPPLPLPQLGQLAGTPTHACWNPMTSENPAFVLDAATFARVLLP